MADPQPASAGPRLIDAYGGGSFRISGETHQGSVIVFGDRVIAWGVTDATNLTAADLAAVTSASPPPDILLIGCGKRAALIQPAVRQSLREAGVVIDAMDTGAACRTYNVLLGEARRVAAALIAVD
jgi:uncharacterized protein